ncbi:hypothetical protein BH10BAC3_BH10BAC3_26720 [soil metagenome]
MGSAFFYDLANEPFIFEKAQEEMLPNYVAVIRLNQKLLPLLTRQQEAAIVNVSSMSSISGSLATYSASKAALHSYTQSLRLTLENTTLIKVFELMHPLVNTEYSEAIGGRNGIAPSKVAEDLLKALETEEYEIHVGYTEQLYKLFLSSPEVALRSLNAGRKELHAGNKQLI